MLFPIEDLLDEERCYRMLREALHPDGLRCPNGHALPADQAPHDRHRAPVMDYRCRECGKVFNLYTGTALQGVRHPPSRLMMILRGFCQGVPTLHLANEFHASRRHLLDRRHHVQGLALERISPLAAGGRGRRGGRDVPERGREGRSARDPDDPPRRRANKFNGHGTYATTVRPFSVSLGDRPARSTCKRLIAVRARHSNPSSSR